MRITSTSLSSVQDNWVIKPWAVISTFSVVDSSYKLFPHLEILSSYNNTNRIYYSFCTKPLSTFKSSFEKDYRLLLSKWSMLHINYPPSFFFAPNNATTLIILTDRKYDRWDTSYMISPHEILHFWHTFPPTYIHTHTPFLIGTK